MREIKFRAWDYQGETMLYSDKREHERYEETDYIFQITHNGLELITLQMTDKCENGEHVQRTEYLPTKCEFMQYTGLKDKNGAEIYENDVIQDELTYPSVIEFRTGAFCISGETLDEHLGRLWSKGYNNVEVIGNIHEQEAE